MAKFGKYIEKRILYALNVLLIFMFLVACASRPTQNIVSYTTATSLQLTPTPVNYVEPSQIPPTSYPGTYDDLPQAIFFYANIRTWPGGGQPDVPFCNHVPELRIWGDGRVVKKVWEGKTQVIWTGYISPDEMQEILAILNKHGFFGTPTGEINPAGTGFDIIVNLQTGSFQSTWQPSNHPPVYQAIVSLITPKLSRFTPQQATLFATPYSGRFHLPDDVPQWPDDFGFHLIDVPEDGQLVRGEALEYLWQAVSQRPVLTVFQDGDNIYAVSLAIPDIITPGNMGRDSKCW